MNKIHLAILANENPDDHILWVQACNRTGSNISYEIIDLTKHSWLENIINSKALYFLSRPPGISTLYKQLYDERLYIISEVLKLPVYPKYEECIIYENKRFLSSWLKANHIPHPETWIFYNKKDAIDFINKSSFPVVAKVNIGASGSGIYVLHSKNEALNYILRTFEGKGAPKRWGPNFEKGNLLGRGIHYLKTPSDILKKLKNYKTKKNEVQKGFILIQEFIPHDFEWRVVRIGDSFFAHKKMKVGEKTSGSLIKGYDNPPLKLLDFVKEITDKHMFYSQAVDIFEDKKRGYLINEMQCMFGQSDPYQMLVNGKPGRYRKINTKWIFEEGDFARNACFDLRLEFVLSQIEKNRKSR